MCNPVWNGLFAPCSVVVEADNPCGAQISAEVAIDRGFGTERTSRTLPLRVDLQDRTDCRIRVDVTSPGVDCTVFITARVEGAQPPPPDVCALRVTPANRFAFETIMASTR